MICKNCGTEHQGNFCPSCGQKVISEHSFRRVFAGGLEILELERGYGRTFLDILIRPSTFFDSYIGGKTRPYTNPVLFLITSIAFYLVIGRLMLSIEPNPRINMTNISLYLSFFMICAIYSIITRLFFAAKYKKYVNYLIVITYLMAVKWFILFVLQFIVAVSNDTISNISYYFLVFIAFTFLPIYLLLIFGRGEKKYRLNIFTILALDLYMIEKNLINYTIINFELDI